MSHLTFMKPLGEILKDAGLIAAPQIEVALHDQIYYQDMRLGEILALRGWIDPKTVDFFAEEWIQLLNKPRNRPLGFYLKRASLITEEQIQFILEEQRKSLMRFGSTAVIKGIVKQNTVDFFLKNLFPAQANASPYKTKEVNRKEIEQAKTEFLNACREEKKSKATGRISQDDITYWVTLSEQKLSGL